MAETNTYTLGKAWNVVSNCASVTGITASGPVVIKSIEIPPNNFGAGDIVQIEACFTKQGTNGGYFTELYWNTNATLTNAILVAQGTVNFPNEGLYAPATYTYSNIFRRIQIVSLSQSTSTNGTKALDPYRQVTAGTFSRGTDLLFSNRISGTSDNQWEIIGTFEGINSIDWTFYSQALSRGAFFIAAGGVQNSNDILRCEWIKISNLTTGNFTVPAPPR